MKIYFEKKNSFKFEYLRLQTDPPAGVSGAPTDNNIMLWNAVIFGLIIDFYILNSVWKCIFFVLRPHDTPFEDGTFKLTLNFRLI